MKKLLKAALSAAVIVNLTSCMAYGAYGYPGGSVVVSGGGPVYGAYARPYHRHHHYYYPYGY